jgi:hypothetical protein
MSDELKPCPFCCGTLGGNNASGHADDCYIVMLLRKQGEPSEFNAAWNRRAPVAPPNDSVFIPQNDDQARMMLAVALNYLGLDKAP